jgi:hypothetical protein
MRKYDAESLAIATVLQQLLIDFGREADFNDAHNITNFYAEDGILVAGDGSFRGRAAIRQFYAVRNERVRREQKDGMRTVRHTFTNVQVLIEDPSHATLNFGSPNYSGAGIPPVTGLVGPTMFSDCQMKFRRHANGQWLITLFRGTPIFIGSDPFLNKIALKSQQ